ncbi:hypothetical protein Tco_1058358 [Tanacetum coccineum]|uniref:Uncharacterized protein n=1 Tax=Tanacetum coccineum TaxID=301880 RepID=A0ABQ5H849_9ASTR
MSILQYLNVRNKPTNERTPSPPPRKKSLSPPQAPSKSISRKSTHYTSSLSPSESLTPTHVAPPLKLHFVNTIKLEPQKLPPPQMSPNDPYRYVVEAGNGEMVRRQIINEYLPTFVRRLHQSVEYKRLLGEVFSLTVGKGFIDGLFVGQKDEDIQTILKATPGVDPTSSDTFMGEYNKLFDKGYPYVDKVARAYLLDPTSL